MTKNVKVIFDRKKQGSKTGNWQNRHLHLPARKVSASCETLWAPLPQRTWEVAAQEQEHSGKVEAL